MSSAGGPIIVNGLLDLSSRGRGPLAVVKAWGPDSPTTDAAAVLQTARPPGVKGPTGQARVALISLLMNGGAKDKKEPERGRQR